MDKYYINWSRVTNNYLVFEVGKQDCLGVFKTKHEAEEFVELLNK